MTVASRETAADAYPSASMLGHDDAMGLALLLVGLVIAVLLWQSLKVQRVRAGIEATRVVTEVVRDLTSKLEAHRGGWRTARQNGELVEWLHEAADMVGADRTEVRTNLLLSTGAELRAAIVAESLAHGKRCRFLEPSDYETVAHYPGPESEPEAWCTESCDEYRELEYLPPETKECPFCGATAELFEDRDSLHAEWLDEMKPWEQFRRLYPREAAAEEARSNKAHSEARQRRRDRYHASVA